MAALASSASTAEPEDSKTSLPSSTSEATMQHGRLACSKHW